MCRFKCTILEILIQLLLNIEKTERPPIILYDKKLMYLYDLKIGMNEK